MKRLAPILILLATPLGAADWVDLFDGRSLSGWERFNGTASYTVEDGAIVGRTSEGISNSFLCTKKDYTDFELEFDVRLDHELNSGVQVRSRLKERTTGPGNNDRRGRVYGPQIEIEGTGSDGKEAGYVYAEATGRGWLTPDEKLIPHKLMNDGQWNHYRIVVEGPRFQTWINGTQVSDLVDEEILRTHPTGFIGLQVHGIRAGTGPYEVAWRNIRIKTVD
jgi:hypothetical protein